MLKIIPLTLEQSNRFVKKFHRHHAPTVSHRWSIGVGIDGPDWFALAGVAICGRPVARAIPQYTTIEVNRLATGGIPNACSKLYAACARIAKEMGFNEIESSILETESGASLKAAGWAFRRTIKGRNWNTPARNGRRTDQPMCDKKVYGRVLIARPQS